MTKTATDISRLPLEERAEIAFKVAVAKAIDEHVRLGSAVYTSRKAKIVKLSAREVRSFSRSNQTK